MTKRNAMLLCLILCMYQSSWACSGNNLNMDGLCKNFRNFAQFIQNENNKISIFANPHAQEELPSINYIDTHGINTINYNNDTNWQDLALARFQSHSMHNNDGNFFIHRRTLTLIRYFYNLCRIEMFSHSPFLVSLGKMNPQLQYITEKSLFVRIESYNIGISNTFKYHPDRNYKLVVVPYNVQQEFFSISELNPELTWNNVERYIHEGRYKEEGDKRYLLGLFKYSEKFVFLRFKIYVP